MVQGLRLCAANAGGQGSILGQRTKSYMPQLIPSTAQSKNIQKERGKRGRVGMNKSEKSEYIGAESTH